MGTANVATDLAVQAISRVSELPVRPSLRENTAPLRMPGREPQYLTLPQIDLVATTPAELTLVLHRCVERSDRTGGQVAKEAGIHRSQLHYLTKNDSLPRKPEQIKAMLTACNLHPRQIRAVLDQWAQLNRRRGEVQPQPEPTVDGDLEFRMAELVETRLEQLASTHSAPSPLGRYLTLVAIAGMLMFIAMVAVFSKFFSAYPATPNQLFLGLGIAGGVTLLYVLRRLVRLGYNRLR